MDKKKDIVDFSDCVDMFTPEPEYNETFSGELEPVIVTNIEPPDFSGLDADIADEIADEIKNLRDLLKRKICDGTQLNELKRLAETIAERNREFAAVYEDAYGHAPNPTQCDTDADKILADAIELARNAVE